MANRALITGITGQDGSYLAELLQSLHAIPALIKKCADAMCIPFDNGWALVHAGNTQPVLALRFEAETEDGLNKYQTFLEKELHEAMERAWRR